jgi:oligopeptide transport system substrate-binding protein
VDTFQIAVNTDGGHQAWSDAVTNQISNTLGIKSTTKSYASFDELRTDVTERTIKTAFRTGWQPDYPLDLQLSSTHLFHGCWIE